MRTKLTAAAAGVLLVLVLAACVPLPPGEVPAGGWPARAATLSPAEVFAQIAPSVAFVDTPAGTGSSFLFEGGYLLTNAHVVYPYPTVRVVFPDGNEFADAPVLNWDLMADIAVVGPLPTTLPPLRLALDEHQPMGSETYLIGYPDEFEAFPQPTITRGILSRRRTWDAIGFTYLQSDALILGGQSGGVLVSAQGEVLGMSGLGWPSVSQFALVAAIGDIVPRVRALLAGEHPDGLGARRLPTEAPQVRFESVLTHRYDDRTFEIIGQPDDDLNLTLVGTGPFEAVLFDFAGGLYEMGDNSEQDVLSWQVRLDSAGPYLLSVGTKADEPITVTVESTLPFQLFPDPDDGQTLGPEQTVRSNMDHPRDSDFYQIRLDAGQSIEVRADSLAVNPALVIDYPGGTEETVAFDSDSGGGLYDDAARLTYRAPFAGLFFIIVEKEGGFFVIDPDTGGYVLTVKDVTAQQDALAAARPPMTVTPTPEPGETGPNIYVDEYERFTLQLPPEWMESPTVKFDTVLFVEPEGAALHISTVDITALGLGELSLGDYVNTVIADYRARQRDLQLETRWRLQTDEGQFGEVLVFTDLDGRRKSSEFIFTADGRAAYHLRFSATPKRHQELTSQIEQVFKTFRLLP